MKGRKKSPADRIVDLLSRVKEGRLVIPQDMPEIPDGLFDRFNVIMHQQEDEILHLVSIVVPGTLRRIGERAFSGCSNLEEILLGDGVESIGRNAFTDCKKLKKVQLPASVKEIDGWAFYGSGLTQPVFSSDGKVLVYYPQTWSDAECSIPEGIEEIGARAFNDVKQLKKVVLPRSLKRIRSMAFTECGFTEIALPKGVAIEDSAFSGFEHLIRFRFEEELDILEERMESCRISDIPFLASRWMKLPKRAYWKEEDFHALAQQCAAGDVEAMDRMGDDFLARAKRAESEEDAAFFNCAMHFWRTRAYRYGSTAARQYLTRWCQANPDARMASLGLDEQLYGSEDGESLNALGFLFFEPDKTYNLAGLDAQGVVEVCAWEGEDAPDEDGFGSESYYDWWYLDEFLTLPEGAGCLHSYSLQDQRLNSGIFQALHDQTAAKIKAAKEQR